MVEDKSTITINDETSNAEETNKTSKIEGADVTSTQEVSTEDLKTEETPKSEGTITSDGLGVTTETVESTTNNAADSALNIVDSIQGNNADDNKSESQAPDHKPTKAPEKGPVKAPANTPKETNNVEPWGDKAPTTEDDLINELVYHGGMAKNVAKDMIEKLKAAKDAKLKANMINHIVWHIATGGPTNKTNGGKGKALHKKDILDYLKTL